MRAVTVAVAAAGREQVEREMEGHIVARTSLMGTYEKARR